VRLVMYPFQPGKALVLASAEVDTDPIEHAYGWCVNALQRGGDLSKMICLVKNPWSWRRRRKASDCGDSVACDCWHQAILIAVHDDP
jgi:hypothetical protein